MTGLPAPRTETDEILVAIHDQLQELLDRIPARQETIPAGPGPVEVVLQEPAVSGTSKTSTAKPFEGRKT